MKIQQVWRSLEKRMVILLLASLVCVFILSNANSVHAESLSHPSISNKNVVHPYVSGCLPWVVAQSTDGNLIVALEEDNCNGYYAIAYFSNLSVSNFHVYISASVSQDGYCAANNGYTYCRTASVGYAGKSHHQVCYFGEGGALYYTNRASGCINV